MTPRCSEPVRIIEDQGDPTAEPLVPNTSSLRGATDGVLAIAPTRPREQLREVCATRGEESLTWEHVECILHVHLQSTTKSSSCQLLLFIFILYLQSLSTYLTPKIYNSAN